MFSQSFEYLKWKLLIPVPRLNVPISVNEFELINENIIELTNRFERLIDTLNIEGLNSDDTGSFSRNL